MQGGVNTAHVFMVRNGLLSYNCRPRGLFIYFCRLLWIILPLQLLHIRGIFSFARGLFAFLEVSPALDSAGPLVLAPCHLFAHQAVPSGSWLSASCPLASSPPRENLQGQIHRQVVSIRQGEMAWTTTIPAGSHAPLRPGERSGPRA